MTRVLPAWTPDSVDPSGNYMGGFEFTPAADIDVVGVWSYFPASGAAYIHGVLWDTVTQSVVASTEVISSAGWTPGTWHRHDFAAPFAAVTGRPYIAVIDYLGSGIAYGGSIMAAPITTPDGFVTTPASGGRFRVGSAFLFPTDVWSGNHGCDIEYVEHGVTPPPPPSDGMTLAAVMDEVAACMDQVAGLNTYAWPAGKVSPPAAVVSYPTEAAYQDTRGFWRLELPLVLAFGRPSDPTTRDMLAAYLDAAGPASVRQLVDDYAWTSCDHVTCKDAQVDVVTVAGVEYLAGLFTLDIVGLK